MVSRVMTELPEARQYAAYYMLLAVAPLFICTDLTYKPSLLKGLEGLASAHLEHMRKRSTCKLDQVMSIIPVATLAHGIHAHSIYRSINPDSGVTQSLPWAMAGADAGRPSRLSLHACALKRVRSCLCSVLSRLH